MRSNMNIEQRLANSAEALDSAVDSYRRSGRTPSVDRTRWLASAAAAAIVIVGVGGIALSATRGSSVPEPATSSATADASVTTTVEPAAAGDVATALLPEPLEAGKSPTDGAGLLGDVNGLVMGLGTRNEMIGFFGGNVSEDEIDACMSAAGFDYARNLTPEEQVADDVRFSVSPAEYAATYGFGVTGWDLGVIPPLQVSPAEYADLHDKQTPEYDDTVRQCSGAFDEDRRAWSDAMTVSVELFRAAIASDERMVAGLAAWRSCVVDAGYDFESPMAMRQTFYDRMAVSNSAQADETLQQVFDDEVRVAVANEPCEIVYNTVQREIIASRFSEFQAMFDAALTSGASPDAQG